MLASDAEVLAHIAEYLGAALPNRTLHVIDAGCGRSSPLDLGREVVITGIDIDEHALTARRGQTPPLDVAIHGDVRNDALAPAGSADLVFSRYVLEHIADAERAFTSMVRWLAPGGFLVLQIPDRQSTYGYVARLTPHWLHIWYYRHVLGRPAAGQPGRHPYRTVHERALSRAGIRVLCDRHGLVLRREYLVDDLVLLRGPKWTLIKTGLALLSRLSGNRLTARHNNLAYVLARPSQASSPRSDLETRR